MVDLDEEFTWFWCGDEGRAVIRGPFTSRADAMLNIAESRCEHDHITFQSTCRRIAQRLPGDATTRGPAIIRRTGNPDDAVQWLVSRSFLCVEPLTVIWLFAEMVLLVKASHVMREELEELPTLTR